MNNKNLLIGIGLVVVVYFFLNKNKDKNKTVVNTDKPCKKWAQPQCITTPCLPICMEY